MQEPETDLSPEREAAVRRLLSSARHDEPVPQAVVERLEEALAGLAPLSPGSGAQVSDLGAVRIRRHNGRRLLLAAAAVLVGGVAVSQFVNDPNTQFSATAESDTSDDTLEPPRAAEGADAAGTGGTSDAPPEVEMEPDALAASPPAENSGGGTASSGRALILPVSLSQTAFATQVTDLLNLGEVRAALRQAATSGNQDAISRDFGAPGDGCAEADYGPGVLLPARYEGELAVLALRPVADDSRVVAALSCGTAFELDSVSVPAGQ
jgi:hypothetical protein